MFLGWKDGSYFLTNLLVCLFYWELRPLMLRVINLWAVFIDSWGFVAVFFFSFPLDLLVWNNLFLVFSWVQVISLGWYFCSGTFCRTGLMLLKFGRMMECFLFLPAWYSNMSGLLEFIEHKPGPFKSLLRKGRCYSSYSSPHFCVVFFLKVLIFFLLYIEYLMIIICNFFSGPVYLVFCILFVPL